MTPDHHTRAAFTRLPLAVSLLALVIALSGTAVAATLAANSVGAKQLKKNAVTAAKIKSNAVTGGKVKNGSIGAADLTAGTLPEKNVAYDHAFAAGDPAPTTRIAGLELTHNCLFLPGPTYDAATTLTPSAGAGELDISVQIMSTSGGVTDAHTDHLDDQASFSRDTEAPASAESAMSWEGMARAGNGPWVRIYVEVAITQPDNLCNVRGFLSVQD